MSKKYMDLRVTGGETELIEFIRVLKSITTLCSFGCSRDIKISIDGDGSAKLSFEILNSPNEEITPWKYEDWNSDETRFLNLSIGE